MPKLDKLLSVRSKVRKKNAAKPIAANRSEQRRADNTSGDISRRRIPGGDTLPDTRQKESYLVDDSSSMSRKRRLQEQDGHSRLAKVHQRYHPDEEQRSAPEGELQNSIRQHPLLDGQKNDGTDNGLNPEPPMNSAAWTEWNNERNEKQLRKQHELGLNPKFTPPTLTPK